MPLKGSIHLVFVFENPLGSMEIVCVGRRNKIPYLIFRRGSIFEFMARSHSWCLKASKKDVDFSRMGSKGKIAEVKVDGLEYVGRGHGLCHPFESQGIE